MQQKRIFAVHMLNDYSGSPLVFNHALTALHPQYEIHLYTARSKSNGFLSGVPVSSVHHFLYRHHPNKIITLLYFLAAQVQLFFLLLVRLQQQDVVYVNTLLPFGAALAGYVRKCKVIYHVHEVSIRPRLLKSLLIRIADLTAAQVIFVSHYLAQQFNFRRATTTVVYNALGSAFENKAITLRRQQATGAFTILMICSLKAYKGVYEFLTLARVLPSMQFELLLNADTDAVNEFYQLNHVPANCTIYPAHADTTAFYQRSHVVLNLSRPGEWIETFGMTILEAMFFGKPVIVPEVGGPAELVNNHRQGYHINGNDTTELVRCLQAMCTDAVLYHRLSNAATERAACFTHTAFSRNIVHVMAHCFAAELFRTTENASGARNIAAAEII